MPPSQRRKHPAPIFSANPRDPPMVERVIDKLEGLLQDLRDKRPSEQEPEDRRPLHMPALYVANHLGCAPTTVKRWLAQHEQLKHEEDLSERFLDVYGRIASEFADAISAKTFKIVKNTEHPQSFAAQKWILPKVCPEIFGDREVELNDESSSDIVETEVMEALTPEQRARIDELDAGLEAANREVDEILDAGKKQAQEAKLQPDHI